MWLNISEVLEINCGCDFESIGRLWLSKRFRIAKIFTSTALWGLWKLRNYLCFQNDHWRDVPTLLQRIVGLLQNWAILYPPEVKQDLDQIKDRLAETCGDETWKTREAINPRKQEMHNFLKQNKGRDGAQVPKNLAPLLEELAWWKSPSVTALV